MNDVRNGPEYAPIRKFVKSPYMIKVTFYNSNDDAVRSEMLDYGKPDDRSWLGRLSFWAFSNGYVVEMEKANG